MVRFSEADGLAASVPLIEFAVPFVSAKFGTVSSGPSARLLSEPRESGSYWPRNPVLTVVQSILLLRLTEVERVDCPAVGVRYKGGTGGLSVRKPTTPGVAEGSKPLRLKSRVMFSELPSAPVRAPRLSRPRSKVLLLVQKAVGGSVRPGGAPCTSQ